MVNCEDFIRVKVLQDVLVVKDFNLYYLFDYRFYFNVLKKSRREIFSLLMYLKENYVSSISKNIIRSSVMILRVLVLSLPLLFVKPLELFHHNIYFQFIYLD